MNGFCLYIQVTTTLQIYTKNRQFSLRTLKKIQMTTYYAHSAQDELGNLLPYEHWQTLQSH